MSTTQIHESGPPRQAADAREADQEQIIKTIKALVAKGDKAREKSDQFYIAAGQHIKTLKAEHAGTWAQWERLLKDKLSLGTGRASELMRIADGRKTVEGIRAKEAEKHRQLRANKKSSVRTEEYPDVERDRKICIALYQKVAEAEREAEEARIEAARQAKPAADEQPTVGKPKQSLSALMNMPTEEEAEEEHQETLYDQACQFLELMTGETRQRFFAHISERYHGTNLPDDVVASGEQRKAEAAADEAPDPINDYPEMPTFLRRAPVEATL